MDALIEYFSQNLPNISFYVILSICVIFGFKWMISNVVSQFKTLLIENRENHKQSIEMAEFSYKHSKESYLQIRAEVKDLQEKVEKLKDPFVSVLSCSIISGSCILSICFLISNKYS
ncbi:hypothetical protein GCM10023210_09630 [Chryseobacterium ginsengisoli]|uniref:Uncharacterized protein n=1 Tax=Chryseobacterium ginsengisoli TaxID=363853 RepID=A0ABP9LWR8_9FLAO